MEAVFDDFLVRFLFEAPLVGDCDDRVTAFEFVVVGVNDVVGLAAVCEEAEVRDD